MLGQKAWKLLQIDRLKLPRPGSSLPIHLAAEQHLYREVETGRELGMHLRAGSTNQYKIVPQGFASSFHNMTVYRAFRIRYNSVGSCLLHGLFHILLLPFASQISPTASSNRSEQPFKRIKESSNSILSQRKHHQLKPSSRDPVPSHPSLRNQHFSPRSSLNQPFCLKTSEQQSLRRILC